MAASPVTPAAGVTYQIATGGTYVLVVHAVPNGGYIVNPPDATDQGLTSAENLYVDPVNPPTSLVGNDTTMTLLPGQVYPLIPGQVTPVYCNAASAGHKFTVVVY